ncbi:MAG: hypothetical protein ACYDAE_23555 [Steroidobacteraceae bacterium]
MTTRQKILGSAHKAFDCCAPQAHVPLLVVWGSRDDFSTASGAVAYAPRAPG